MFSKEKQYNDPWQNKKEPTECLILEVKNPSGEQPYGPSEELNEIITVCQDNIHDGQDFLLMDVNIVNLEESLQNSLTEKVSKTQDKISPIVGNDKKVEKLVILKRDSQNIGKKELTNFPKRVQNLQPEFNRLCSLISNLLNILGLKSIASFLKQMQIRKVFI